LKRGICTSIPDNTLGVRNDTAFFRGVSWGYGNPKRVWLAIEATFWDLEIYEATDYFVPGSTNACMINGYSARCWQLKT